MGGKKLIEGIHEGLLKALVVQGSLPLEDALKWKRYQIMRIMGWGYEEYSNAPHSLIEEIWAFLLTENKVREVLKDNG